MSRPPSAASILKKSKIDKRKFEPKTPIATDMFLPNHSGDLSKGNVRVTPTQDLNPVNKKYVDDKTVESFPTSLTAGSVLFSDGSNIAQDNANLFWNNTTKVFSVSSITTPALITTGRTELGGTLDFNSESIVGLANAFVNTGAFFGLGVSAPRLVFEAAAIEMHNADFDLDSNNILNIGQAQFTAAEYISSDNANELSFHFADEDVGAKFYSGANELLNIVRTSNALSTRTRLDAPVFFNLSINGTDYFRIGNNYIWMDKNVRFPIAGKKMIFGGASNVELYWNGDFVIDPDIVTAGANVLIGGVGDSNLVARGHCIPLTNKTGGVTVKGQCVAVYTTTAIDDAFVTASLSDDNVIGIVLEAGVADGAEAWIVVSGIADVLMDAGGSARGDRIISSGNTAGSGDVWNTGGSNATHFLEIGHCIETRTGAGLARCVLHFN